MISALRRASFDDEQSKGMAGAYYPASDIVAVDPSSADGDGMGADDGYYATLLHELLHATRHPSRLSRSDHR